MKRDIDDLLAKCSNCKQVQPEHQRSGGLTPCIDILYWKFGDIHMDFIAHLPSTRSQHD